MSKPTNADLTAAVAQLTTENEALRGLLAAVRAYADAPDPADWTHAAYVIELENRLGGIAVYANGDRSDLSQNVYALVLGDRATEMRDRAAKPVRYAVKCAPPAPSGAQQLCAACDNEPATVTLTTGSRYCEACAPAVQLVTGADVAQPPERGLASCGHPADEDGECDCSSWPERAVLAR